MASPPSRTLTQPKYSKRQRLVDFTRDENEEDPQEEDTTQSFLSPPSRSTKHCQRKLQKLPYTPPSQEKAIQWKTAEVMQYNPNFPAAHHLLAPATQLLTPMSLNTVINPPFFPPAPRLLPLMAPSSNPVSNPQRTQNPVPMPFNIIQPHIKNPLANSPYLSNPLTQTSTERHTHTNTKKQNPKSTR